MFLPICINKTVCKHILKIVKSNYQIRHVCPSVCDCAHGTIQLHWMDLHEILYLKTFQKSATKK